MDCEVCGSADEVSVVASQLGPVSHARCRECQRMTAEKTEAICLCRYLYGTKFTFDGAIKAYVDGAYQSVEAALSHFAHWEREFDADESLRMLRVRDD